MIQSESVRQRTVANSSTDAEIRAASSAARQVIGHRQVLELLGFATLPPSPIYIDNDGARSTFKTGNINKMVKHLATDVALVRDYQTKNWITIEDVNTNENLADIGTKPLRESVLSGHRDKVLIKMEHF